MSETVFPPNLDSFTKAEIPIAGLVGRVVNSDCGKINFIHAETDVVVPMHHHGAQWGMVLEGAMELIMGGKTETYRRGDTHYIPAGVDHEAKLQAGWKGLYIFLQDPS